MSFFNESRNESNNNGNGKSQGHFGSNQAEEGRAKEFKWTELGALWETESGNLVGKIYDAESSGDNAIHEHRKLGYKLAAISRGDTVMLKRNEDKTPGSKQPDFKLLLVKNDD